MAQCHIDRLLQNLGSQARIRACRYKLPLLVLHGGPGLPR